MEVSDTISRLARECDLGAMALIGARARGLAVDDDPVEVFATVPLERTDRFGTQLADETGGIVRVYDCRLISWAHPLHLCARWLNVDRLPSLPCPRGAVSRWTCKATGARAAVLLETLPHFHPVDGYVPTPPGEFVRVFGPPPIGGFLI